APATGGSRERREHGPVAELDLVECDSVHHRGEERRPLDDLRCDGDDVPRLLEVRGDDDGVRPARRTRERVEIRPEQTRVERDERRQRGLPRTAADAPDAQPVARRERRLEVSEKPPLPCPQSEGEELRVIACGDESDARRAHSTPYLSVKCASSAALTRPC